MREILKRLKGLAGRQWPLMLSLVIVAGLLLAFGQIADEVMEGSTASFDSRIVFAFRSAGDPTNPIGPYWLHSAARDVTALGSVIVLMTILLTVVGYLYLVGKHVSAWLMLAAVLGGTVLNSTLKYAFGRPRPELVDAEKLLTASFPSGHTALSAITYLTLAALLTRTTTSYRLRTYFIAIGVFLTLAVGVSRVYLGVHYPTDVVAGWCIGTVWALGCWTIFSLLQQQGEAEPPGRQ